MGPEEAKNVGFAGSEEPCIRSREVDMREMPLAGRVLGSADNSFVIAEWRDAGAPPGPPRWIAPLHVHHNDDEAWYVLEGKLCVKVGDDTVEASAGAAVLVPRGTPHTYWNPDPAPLRYLLVMTPTIHQ